LEHSSLKKWFRACTPFGLETLGLIILKLALGHFRLSQRATLVAAPRFCFAGDGEICVDQAGETIASPILKGQTPASRKTTG
jgi:hypothetical protein